MYPLSQASRACPKKPAIRTNRGNCLAGEDVVFSSTTRELLLTEHRDYVSTMLNIASELGANTEYTNTTSMLGLAHFPRKRA
jgi:hypothetical protein